MTSLRDQLAAILHATEDGPTCDCPDAHREIYNAMADNVLHNVEVTEEWGLVWPPTGDIDWFGNEMEARATATAPQPPELAMLRDLGRLRRRWVLKTKPEHAAPRPATGATT